jgi:hypothetical protein
LSRSFSAQPFLKVLLFEWLFPMLSSLQSFLSGFLGMAIQTGFDALIGTILAIRGGVLTLELFVMGQQSLRAFLDRGCRFSYTPISGQDVTFWLSAEDWHSSESQSG